MIIYWKYAHNHALCNTFNPPPVGAYSTLLRAAAVSSFLNAKKLAMHKKIVQKNTDSTCSTGLRQKEGKKLLTRLKEITIFAFFSLTESSPMFIYTSLVARATNVVVLWTRRRPPSRSCQSRPHSGQSTCARTGWCGWHSSRGRQKEECAEGVRRRDKKEKGKKDKLVWGADNITQLQS